MPSFDRPDAPQLHAGNQRLLARPALQAQWARSLLTLTDPTMDWVSIASGFGMPALRCATAESFDSVFARSMTEAGPSFIEAVIE